MRLVRFGGAKICYSCERFNRDLFKEVDVLDGLGAIRVCTGYQTEWCD